MREDDFGCGRVDKHGRGNSPDSCTPLSYFVSGLLKHIRIARQTIQAYLNDRTRRNHVVRTNVHGLRAALEMALKKPNWTKQRRSTEFPLNIAEADQKLCFTAQALTADTGITSKAEHS